MKPRQRVEDLTESMLDIYFMDKSVGSEIPRCAEAVCGHGRWGLEVSNKSPFEKVIDNFVDNFETIRATKK